MIPKKNFMYLLQEYKCYLEKCENTLDLLLIGDDLEKKRLQQFVIKNRLDRKVHFLEFQTQERLRELYHNAACSSSEYETWGLVINEAMSCGNIVIGSNCGGMSEKIEDGIDGFLVEPKDPYILAQTINKVLALTQEEVSCIQKNSVRKIKTKFSCEIITKQMENFYKLVINEYKKSSLD